MKPKEFKEKYNNAKTWLDGENLLKQLTKEQLNDFIITHFMVQRYTGLDMCQVWYLSTAKLLIKHMK